MKRTDQINYTPEHLWVRPLEDGILEAGVTDYAQEMLGDVVFVEPPETGSRLSRGSTCGLIESVKTGSDLHAPLDGTVISVNKSLLNSPEIINDAPYKAWIFRFRPDNMDDLSQLLDEAAYQAFIKNA